MAKKHKKRFAAPKQAPVQPTLTMITREKAPSPIPRGTLTHIAELKFIALIFLTLLAALSVVILTNSKTGFLNGLSQTLSQTLHIEE